MSYFASRGYNGILYIYRRESTPNGITPCLRVLSNNNKISKSDCQKFAELVASSLNQIVFGYYWEVVSERNGEVVNSGFSREPMDVGEHPTNIQGFLMRVRALKEQT